MLNLQVSETLKVFVIGSLERDVYVIIPILFLKLQGLGFGIFE